MTKNMEDTVGMVTNQSQTSPAYIINFDGDGFAPKPIWDAPQPTYVPIYIPNLPPQPAPAPFQWFNPSYTTPADNPTFETTLLGRKVKTKPGQNLFETGTIMGVVVNSSYGIIAVSVIVYSSDNVFYTSLLSTLSLEESI